MSVSRTRRLATCPATRVHHRRLPSAAAAVLLGSLAFAGAAQAAVNGSGHSTAASSSVNGSPLPAWYHTPLTPAALSHEVAVPRDPETVTGQLRLTRADYRNAGGQLAVDASQAIGQTLTAGEALQLPGSTLFSLNSHLPAIAAQQQITALKPSLTNVTGVTCEGYTDYGPHSARRDIVLGKQRALRVCALIHSENPDIAITTVSYGSTLPAVVGGSTHPPRSLNRRVIIDITNSAAPAAPAPAPGPMPAPAPTTTPTPTPTTTTTTTTTSVAPVPAPPTLNSATGGDSQATIVFAAPPSGAPTGYEVSTDAGTTWTPVTTDGPSPYTTTVTGLSNGTTYTVEVRAVEAVGDSGPSNSLQVTPATVPDAPTITDGFSTEPNDDYIITLSWTDANDGGSAITGWQYSQDQALPYQALTGVTYNAGTYSATFDSGQDPCSDFNSDMYFTIEAINGVGTSVASNSYDVGLYEGC